MTTHKKQLEKIRDLIFKNVEAGEAVMWAQGLRIDLTPNALPEYDPTALANCHRERLKLKQTNEALVVALQECLNEFHREYKPKMSDADYRHHPLIVLINKVMSQS